MAVSTGKAVFLSYASQDADAAKRISEGLRAAGVEVWFDQEGGLVGGDAWDRKIREQISACTLFVPLISANTQARKEGYFRLEWHLAEERVRLIAKGVPFIVPVSIDGTTERGALAPDAFLAVQWTRLPAGEAPAAFVERVKKLLGGESAPSSPAAPLPAAPAASSAVATENSELSPAVRLPSDSAIETFERQRPRWQRALPVLGALVVGALLTAVVAWRLWPMPKPAPVARFSYRLPDGQAWRGTNRIVLAVSPDGQRLVYNATGGLYLRNLNALDAQAIVGTDASLSHPFFSPDGQWVGFYQNGQLKRVAISGGTPVIIGAVAGTITGAHWTPDGSILFGQSKGIMRVPASGGTPVVAIPAAPGKSLTCPRLMPDGDTVLFTERPSLLSLREETRVVAQRISTGERKVLVEGGVDARYLATGHLVYVVGNVLMGVAFDGRRLAVVGTAVPLVQGVMRSLTTNVDAANYDIAADGTLAWAHSLVAVGSITWQLGLCDRAGKLTPLNLPAGPYETPRVSLDGTRVAFSVADAKESYVAIYDLDGKTAVRRLTFGGNSRFPVWSRDSQHVTFQSDRDGDVAIFRQRADGSTPPERLTKPEKDTAHVPSSWSPNDEHLLFAVVPAKDPEASGALWIYTRASGTAAPFANVKEAAQSPMFSPDGRWIAYAIRSGNTGLYLQPFPATGAQYQVPRLEGDNSGTHGFWTPDGTTLNFAPGPGRLAAVSITTNPTVAFGNQTPVPRPFAVLGSGTPTTPRNYDIMPDGRLIGLIAPGQATAASAQAEIRVALNWTEELKRLVPVK